MELTRAAHVIVSTLSQSFEALQIAPHKVGFSLVDEAGQGTEPETMMAVGNLGLDGHLILVGDHRQLAPSVCNPVAAQNRLDKSMFERLQKMEGLHYCKVLLDCQYRMLRKRCGLQGVPEMLFASAHRRSLI